MSEETESINTDNPPTDDSRTLADKEMDALYQKVRERLKHSLVKMSDEEIEEFYDVRKNLIED